MTALHRQKRQIWCWVLQNWTRRNWGRVLFTDECRVRLNTADVRVQNWRRSNERYLGTNIVQYDRFNSKSVIIWAEISQLAFVDGKLNANRYVNNIVEPVIIPYLQQNFRVILVQQDNARPHTARVTGAAFQGHNIRPIP